MIKRKYDKTFNGYKYKHPSYGMISISRCSGNVECFGSDIKHHNFFDLEISGAEVLNSLGRSSYFPKDTKLRVRLGASQFVEMIGSMNTSGTPCTIVSTKEEGHLQYEPPPSALEYAENYTEHSGKEAEVLSAKLVERGKEILTSKGGLKKAEKDELLSLITSLSQQVKSNLPFAVEQGKEAVQKVKAQGMMEIDARMQHLITSTGIKALQDEDVIKKLTQEK